MYLFLKLQRTLLITIKQKKLHNTFKEKNVSFWILDCHFQAVLSIIRGPHTDVIVFWGPFCSPGSDQCWTALQGFLSMHNLKSICCIMFGQAKASGLCLLHEGSGPMVGQGWKLSFFPSLLPGAHLLLSWGGTLVVACTHLQALVV